MPDQPIFPLHQMTTGELSAYRGQLERAIKTLGNAPVVADLRAKLTEIQAEEASRASIQESVGEVGTLSTRMEHYSA
jgi:hypothetical protein